MPEDPQAACLLWGPPGSRFNELVGMLRQVPGLFNNLFLLSCNPAVNTEFNGNYQDDFSDNEITGTAKLVHTVLLEELNHSEWTVSTGKKGEGKRCRRRDRAAARRAPRRPRARGFSSMACRMVFKSRSRRTRARSG